MGLRLGEIRLRHYPVGPGMILVWLLGALGLGVAFYRWMVGIGPTTNLSDGRGWGIWISFDMMSGIGLAAGAFTVAAVVYIFNLKQFYPIVRPTILTGFISYTLAGLTLLVDLSQPQRIWQLIIYWNIHSPLFEIGWCVMLYLTVLALEFSPVVFERFKLQRPLKIIKAITIPLVVLGVLLSTLHQSSLGSLFLIIPGRMHPLWYSNIIPFLFIISCVAAGLAMTIFESFISSRAFGREIELPLLSELARVMVVVLALFFTVRIQDLMNRDALQYVFQPTYQSAMFLGELVLGVIVPFFLLLFAKVRNSKTGLFYSSVLVLLGFIAHRLNTAITSMENWPERLYLPSWQELAITAGLAAFGFTAFAFVARYFDVFSHHAQPAAEQERAAAEATVVPAK